MFCAENMHSYSPGNIYNYTWDVDDGINTFSGMRSPTVQFTLYENSSPIIPIKINSISTLYIYISLNFDIYTKCFVVTYICYHSSVDDVNGQYMIINMTENYWKVKKSQDLKEKKTNKRTVLYYIYQWKNSIRSYWSIREQY